jgi:hypothetical protein
VQEVGGSILDGRDDLRVAVPRAGDGNPAHEVEEAVAVDVLDHDPRTPRDDKRVFLEVGVRREGAIAVDDGPGARSRRRRLDVRIVT